MTPRALALGDLPNAVPALLANRTAIVLLAGGNLEVAAHTAWAFARAAAGERRVALIDATLDAHALDAAAPSALSEGVVDAFEHGASLSHVACEQPVLNLHFIGAGTATSRPDAIIESPRWERLRRGFASEGAVLLLFATLPIAEQLALVPDGVVALGDAAGPMREDWSDVPLLGTVTGRPSIAAPAPGIRRPSPTFTTRRSPVGSLRPSRSTRHRRRTRPYVTGVVAIGAVLIAGTLLIRHTHSAPPDQPSSAASRPPAAASSRTTTSEHPATPALVTPSPLPAAKGDTLFYSVQVAAFNTLPAAMAYGGQLKAKAAVVAVTPTELGRQGVWYRVLVGALSTPAAADSLRRALWHDGLVDRPQGTILRTPLAYALGAFPSARDARKAAEGLRERGIPAYIVPEADGTARMLLGAFEVPEQAHTADSLLTALGVRGVLITRIGTPE